MAPDNCEVKVDGKTYDMVEDEGVLQERGLKKTISDEQVGEYVGEGRFVTYGEGIIKAYDYNSLKGDSVLIADYAGKYHYLLFCGSDADPDFMTMKDILDKYGIEDIVESITVDGVAMHRDGKTVYDLLCDLPVRTELEFEEEINNVIADDSIQSKRICFNNSDSDIACFIYYPQVRYLFCANKYFRVTQELFDLIHGGK